MRRPWPSKAVAPLGGGDLRPTDIYHLPAALYTHYIKLCFMQFPWQGTNYYFVPNNTLFSCVIIKVFVLSISCHLRVIYSPDNLDTVVLLEDVPRTFTVLAIMITLSLINYVWQCFQHRQKIWVQISHTLNTHTFTDTLQHIITISALCMYIHTYTDLTCESRRWLRILFKIHSVRYYLSKVDM